MDTNIIVIHSAKSDEVRTRTLHDREVESSNKLASVPLI